MAIHEVHVRRKDGFGDPRGRDVAAEAKRTLGIDTDVKTTSVYKIEGPTLEDTQVLVHKAFVDPIIEEGGVKITPTSNLNPSIEVAYKLGVTDPVAGTINKV